MKRAPGPGVLSGLGVPAAARGGGWCRIYTTNVAYGGTDRRDLYITESYSATILRARVDVPGRQMFSHL